MRVPYAAWRRRRDPGNVPVLIGTVAPTPPPPAVDLPEQTGYVHEPYLEWSITATDYAGNAYDVSATATFTRAGGGVYTVPMYYAGGDAFKFRFTGPRTGTYEVVTSSADSVTLDGVTTRAVIGANPDALARGYLTTLGNIDGTRSFAYLTGNDGVPRRTLYPVLIRHDGGDNVNPAGLHGVNFVSSTSGTRATQVEETLTYMDTVGALAYQMSVYHNWVQYGRDYNQTSTNTEPSETTFTILEDVLQRFHNSRKFLHLWAWADGNGAADKIAGGENGYVCERVYRMIVGRLGCFPNWALSYSYDLEEWTTLTAVRAWHAIMQGHSNLPRLYMARESQERYESNLTFDLGTNKLDVFSWDGYPTGPNFHADALDPSEEYPAPDGRPNDLAMIYEARFFINRQNRPKTFTYTEAVTRRMLWQFAMANGTSMIYGQFSSPYNVEYTYPERMTYPTRFFADRFPVQLGIRSSIAGVPADGLLLATSDETRQVLYKQTASSITVTIPPGMTGVPVVGVDALAASYVERNLGTFSSGTHAVTLPAHSDWAIAVGDFDLTSPLPPEEPPEEPDPPPPGDSDYVTLARSLGAVVVHANEGGTAWTDESGNNFHGSPVGSPTWTATGGPGASLPGYYSFNGTSQYISVGDATALRVQQHALVWWERGGNTQVTDYATSISKGDDSYHIRKNLTTQGDRVYTVLRGAEQTYGYATVVTGAWQMFMSRWDGAAHELWHINAGVATRVVNEVRTGSIAHYARALAYGAQDHDTEGWRRFWKGDLASVLLFPSAISSADFENLHLATSEALPEPPEEPDPDPPVEGATYVSLTGSDTTGTGTEANPYRSLKKAAEETVPGTSHTIYLRGGYYDVVNTDAYMTLGNGGEIKFNGTESVPITVRSYPGEWAIIDGIDHTRWPRTLNDGESEYEPRLLQFVGTWVNWEHLEFRNSVGGAFRAFALDCKWRHCVFQANHAMGLDIQGSRNEVAYNLFQDNYSASNDGNSANGMFIRFSEQLDGPVGAPGTRFPDETASAYNHVHHNVAHNVSDDGFGGNTSTNGIWEYNVSFENGYGATGNGEGFKMGFAYLNDTGNIFRYNLAWDCKNTFNTNTAEGILCHNNTAYRSRGTSFLLTSQATDESGNTARNNLSVEPGNGWHRSVGSKTVHTHNAGVPTTWTSGTSNYGFGDARFISVNPASADFLRLASDSPARGAGTVVNQASDTDLGAIPFGQEFAGGWDWRALMAAFPSHGLKARSPMNPIAQT